MHQYSIWYMHEITSNIYKINTWFLRSPRGQAPWEEENVVFILYILGVILMHILDGILMHILDVLIRMHILDVLLLLQQPAGPGLARFRHLVGARSWGFEESKIHILQSLWHRSGPQRWHQMSLIRINIWAIYSKCWISTPALRQKLRIEQDETTDLN